MFGKKTPRKDTDLDDGNAPTPKPQGSNERIKEEPQYDTDSTNNMEFESAQLRKNFDEDLDKDDQSFKENGQNIASSLIQYPDEEEKQADQNEGEAINDAETT